MPTYEYACGSCDSRHEIVQKMTDPTLTDCPDCGQPSLRKLFNGVGVVFKGSGFYRTDSRSGNSESSSSNSSSSSSASDSSSPSSGKSESASADKPASKSESKSGSKSASKPASTASSAS